MSQTVESPTVGGTGLSPRAWGRWLRWAVLAVLIALLYSQIVSKLVLDWAHDSNYSHGFIVLPISVWIIWKNRRRLAVLAPEPSWSGLFIIIGSLALLTLGVLGAELFLSRTSLLFLLAGLLVQFRGWRFFRAVLFPWAVLFLTVPLPAIIFNEIALPLQFQASRFASAMLGLVGVPVLREGNVIVLPSLSLDVVEACSGLRSLISLIALAIFYGYFVERKMSRRILLVLAAIPIAVLANGLRIMGSGFLGEYWSPEKAEGFFHLFSGLLILFVSFSLLIGFHAFILWVGRTTARQA
jgi:exosortase